MKLFSKNQKDPFIIAEVGQNHNGDLELAREYIRVFANEGAQAIKFQTRDNKYLFAQEAYNAPYTGDNSFGETYGKHREQLELNPESLRILKSDCIKHGVYFMSTPFDEPSLERLTMADVDILKVASFDIGNLPLINRIADAGVPVIVSVGGGKIDQIRSSIDLLLNKNVETAVLHCVSEYPCEFNRLGLDNIERLKAEFPDCTIGLSDHFNGILSGPIGYMKGARIFEKHVTMNRASKGTDHSFALEPEGFRKFVRDIKRVEHMMPVKSEVEIGNEPVFKKLGKSIVAKINIDKGSCLTLENLSGKIFNRQIIPVRESNKIIGKKLLIDIKAGEPINYSDIE